MLQSAKTVKLDYAYAPTKMTLNYNVCTMRQLWEDFKLPSTPSDTVQNDVKTTSTLQWYRPEYCNLITISDDGTMASTCFLHSTAISHQESSEEEDDSHYRSKCQEAKITLCLPFAIGYMLSLKENVWVTKSLQCFVYLSLHGDYSAQQLRINHADGISPNNNYNSSLQRL